MSPEPFSREPVYLACFSELYIRRLCPLMQQSLDAAAPQHKEASAYNRYEFKAVSFVFQGCFLKKLQQLFSGNSQKYRICRKTAISGRCSGCPATQAAAALYSYPLPWTVRDSVIYYILPFLPLHATIDSLSNTISELPECRQKGAEYENPRPERPGI